MLTSCIVSLIIKTRFVGTHYASLFLYLIVFNSKGELVLWKVSEK